MWVCLRLSRHGTDHSLTPGLALQVAEHIHMEAGAGPDSGHTAHNSWWKTGKDSYNVLPVGCSVPQIIRFSVLVLGKLYTNLKIFTVK